MNYRLLIDCDALEFLAGLKKAEQRRIHRRMREIQAYPSKYSDYIESDDRGRRLDVNVCGRYAITFWEDFADRHVKVLEIKLADA